MFWCFGISTWCSVLTFKNHTHLVCNATRNQTTSWTHILQYSTYSTVYNYVCTDMAQTRHIQDTIVATNEQKKNETKWRGSAASIAHNINCLAALLAKIIFFSLKKKCCTPPRYQQLNCFYIFHFYCALFVWPFIFSILHPVRDQNKTIPNYFQSYRNQNDR